MRNSDDESLTCRRTRTAGESLLNSDDSYSSDCSETSDVSVEDAECTQKVSQDIVVDDVSDESDEEQNEVTCNVTPDTGLFGDYNERDYVDLGGLHEESNTNPMHKYHVRGTFSDPALLRKTYGNVLNTQNRDARNAADRRIFRDNSWKLEVPFQQCKYCKALLVKPHSVSRAYTDRVTGKKETHVILKCQMNSGTLTCCMNGTRMLHEDDLLTPEFVTKYNLQETYCHSHFRQFARELNTEMALACTVTSPYGGQGYVKFKPGVHALRYSGGTMYRMSNEGTRNGVLQGIIHDKGVEYFFRSGKLFLDNVRRSIANNFVRSLLRVNLFMKEILKHKSELQLFSGDRAKHKLHFQSKEPIENTVVAVIQNENEPAVKTDYVFIPPMSEIPENNTFSTKPTPIKPESPFFEGLHFPVLNPLGRLCPGGKNKYRTVNSFGVRTVDGAITLLQYFKSKLLQRNSDSFLHRCGRLFEHYCIMSFLRWQDEVLAFHVARAKKKVKQFGEKVRVWLPDTLLGVRKFQKKKAHDGMAVANRMGMPHLFITLTCNPNAPEIKEHLRPGEKVTDRLDLCCQYFYAQHLQLRSLLNQGHLFGRKPAYIQQVVEFQHRGLPHSHTIVCFGGPSITQEEIDDFVCAEFPENSTPEERDLVRKHMMHTCRDEKCVRNGHRVCGYPFALQEKTEVPVNGGKPKYRRRDFFPEEQNDVSRVVPYNMALLKLFNCHVNVEWCGSTNCIAYLFS